MPAVPAPIPFDEPERLNALKNYNILDTPEEQAFDDLARLAAQICNAPISLVSLLDEGRQWFKAHVGLDIRETPRDMAFCAHAIQQDEVFIVPDAEQDSRFATNPLVTGGPGIRFYAGVPLTTPDHHKLGTLCVLDREPRELTQMQRDALQALSRQVMAQLELRRTIKELNASNGQLASLATTDPLTGLHNVRSFQERLAAEIERSSRTMEPLSLIMIDIDRFKSYNETYGKPAGDSLLQTFGKLLRESLRVVDFVARYGGEEFVVLLPNTHTHRSQEIAERLRFLIELHSWPLRQVTASFGATTFNQSEDPYSLIEEAEEALSHSKQTGRNRVTHSAYTTTIRKAA